MAGSYHRPQAPLHKSHQSSTCHGCNGRQPPCMFSKDRLGHPPPAVPPTDLFMHARTDYASVVWHRYGKTTGPASRLQRLDNTALRFALGVFRAHPTPFLRHDAYAASSHARLDAQTDAAILRLLTLPPTNPAAELTRAVFNRNRKTYQSSVHHALAHPSSICGSMPMLPECLDASKAGL